jgi:hypothetical protein
MFFWRLLPPFLRLLPPFLFASLTSFCHRCGAVLHTLPAQVRAGLHQALELVAKEAAGTTSGLPDPSAVAEAVEASLYTLFGELAAALTCCV